MINIGSKNDQDLQVAGMIRHSETAKMSRTSSFFALGGQLASSGGQTLISDSLKLQLNQHRGQLNLLKVEVYFKPPYLNIALWVIQTTEKINSTLLEDYTLFMWPSDSEQKEIV